MYLFVLNFLPVLTLLIGRQKGWLLFCRETFLYWLTQVHWKMAVKTNIETFIQWFSDALLLT